MNATPIDEVEVETPLEDGVGEYLRKSREALNLGRAEVADGMHLKENIIAALEEDDSDALPSPVFIQGYLRKYARLLDIPEEPLLKAYKQQEPHKRNKKNGPLAGSPIKPKISGSHAIVRLITWFIVLGLMALLVIWWQGGMQWPIGQAEESQPATTQDIKLEGDLSLSEENQGEQHPLELVAIKSATISEAEPQSEAVVSDDSQTVSIQEALPSSYLPAEVVENDTLDDQVASVVEAEEIEAGVTDEIAAAQELELDPVISAADITEQITSSSINYANSIVVEFSDACWTEIRGFNNSYKLLGNMQKGERHVLGGEPPYSFILGNSQAATLTVKGQEFDIEAHSTGNVARFVLQAEDISNP